MFIGLSIVIFNGNSANAFESYTASARAYNTNCAQCHGNFATKPYVSLADGALWFDSLHNVHRKNMLNRDCVVCHGSSNNPVFTSSSSGGNDLPALSCAGCHGRAEDERKDNQTGVWGKVGAGLRQHHWNSDVTICADCHSDTNPAEFTPVGENVLPPYYANPGINHPDIPISACNVSGNENFAGSSFGLDNDGDLFYDANDSQCSAGSPPAADAGPDRTVCGNEEITFDGSASSDPDGDVLIFSWDFGDGSIASGITATHRYPASGGTYTVTMTVSDGQSSVSDTAIVTVIDCTSSISGTITITYPGWSQTSVDIMYQVRDPGLPPSAPVYSGTLDIVVTPSPTANNVAVGTYTISGIADGTYDVALKHANHIAGMAAGVVVSGSDVNGIDITIFAGDADGDDDPTTNEPGGDNDCDISDYDTLVYQYGLVPPFGPGTGADFDDDNDVDIHDANGINYNYEKAPGNWYYATGPTTEGLVARWSFDEMFGSIVHDSTANQFHGTTNGTQWVPGIIGSGALDFTGNAAVYVPDEETPPPMEIGKLQYGTITIWFQYREFTDQIVPLLYFGESKSGSAQNSLILEIGHGGPSNRRLYFTIINARFCYDSGINLEPNAWYHFAAVVGPTGNTGYLNGEEMTYRHYNLGSNASYTNFFASVTAQELMAFGYGRYGKADPFYHHNGLIDEICIYQRPLEPYEIQEILNSRNH